MHVARVGSGCELGLLDPGRHFMMLDARLCLAWSQRAGRPPDHFACPTTPRFLVHREEPASLSPAAPKHLGQPLGMEKRHQHPLRGQSYAES